MKDFKHTKNGRIMLKQLTLTSNQNEMINEYAQEMGYSLVMDNSIPFISKGNRKVPIQLINGSIMAVCNTDRIDLIERYREMNQTKNMLCRMNVKSKAAAYLIKGACSLLPLEL